MTYSQEGRGLEPEQMSVLRDQLFLLSRIRELMTKNERTEIMCISHVGRPHGLLLVGRKPDGCRELAVEPGEIGKDCQAKTHPCLSTH